MSRRVDIGVVFSCLAASICLSGCAADTHVAVASPLPAQHQLLDLRIARVTIDGNRMTEALEKLAEQIKSQSGGKLVFEYSMSAELEKHNPRISIRVQDILLRALLDEMCRQAKWTYITGAPGLAPPGLYFPAPDELRPYPPQ